MSLNNTNKSIISNKTDVSQDYYEEPFVVSLLLSYFVVALGLLIIALSLLTIHTLYKCRKLTAQIRIMSIHMTVANLSHGAVLLSASVYRIINGSYCNSLMKLLPITFCLFNMFLTAAGMDRLLSLIYSIQYTMWTKRQNAYVFIGLLYIIGIGTTGLPNLAGLIFFLIFIINLQYMLFNNLHLYPFCDFLISVIYIIKPLTMCTYIRFFLFLWFWGCFIFIIYLHYKPFNNFHLYRFVFVCPI